MGYPWFVPIQPRQSPQGYTEAPYSTNCSRADEIMVGSYQQDEVPQIPVTPVSAEALASLHNIVKQDALTFK